MSLLDTANFLNELRYHMCQVFTVGDLKYLRAAGRLSNLASMLGIALHIKPLLKGNEEGKIVGFGKVIGREKSIRALAEQYETYVQDAGAQTVGIAHGDCPQDAALLAELLNRNMPPREIITVCYEPVTGAHVGPGTLALFFFGDKSFRTAKH